MKTIPHYSRQGTVPGNVTVVVAQRGAREHFLAARALHAQGNLAGLVIDWYATPLVRWMATLTGARTVGLGRAALSAQCATLPDRLVHAFPIRSLMWKWRASRLATRNRLYDGLMQTDAAFGASVAKLKLPAHKVFFGFSYASLEALRVEKKRKTLTILDQIDPGPFEFRLVAEEMRRYPEIAGPPPVYPTAYFDRNRQEWELADILLVNSEWSRKALVAEGADPGKIEVLPLAYESPAPPTRRARTSTNAPLRVLWLGQVNMRKGIHYLIEAARLLAREAVEICVAGTPTIRHTVMADAPKNIRWLGQIPRSDIAGLYNQSDVFVLPTLSDGFALTQLEALTHGLPVIVTPHCGEVIQDAVTGFLIPARDGHALAEAIVKFVRQPGLAAEMSPRCVDAARAFSEINYRRRLMEIIENRVGRRGRPSEATPAPFPALA